MSSTALATAAPSSLDDAINSGAGSGQATEGISIDAFLASLVSALVVFGIEFGLFLLLHGRFNRI